MFGAIFLRECAFVQSRVGFVALIHEKSGVKTSIEFSGIFHSFQLDQSITILDYYIY